MPGETIAIDPKNPDSIQDALQRIEQKRVDTGMRYGVLETPSGLLIEVRSYRDSINIIPIVHGNSSHGACVIAHVKEDELGQSLAMSVSSKALGREDYIHPDFRALPMALAAARCLLSHNPQITNLSSQLALDNLKMYFAARGQNDAGEDPVEVGKRRIIQDQGLSDAITKQKRFAAFRESWSQRFVRKMGFTVTEVIEVYQPHVDLGEKIAVSARSRRIVS